MTDEEPTSLLKYRYNFSIISALILFTFLLYFITIVNMAPSRAALLIGKIKHSRREWEALKSLVNLKVRNLQSKPLGLYRTIINNTTLCIGIHERLTRRIPSKLPIRRLRRRGRIIPLQRVHERHGPFRSRTRVGSAAEFEVHRPQWSRVR